MAKKNLRDRKVNGNQFAYLLDEILTGEEYDGLTDEAKIEYVLDEFESYNCMYVRRAQPSLPKRIGDWLQGLPSCVSLPFYCDEIAATLQDFGIQLNKRRDGDWDSRSWKIINDWFYYWGVRIVQAAEYFGIELPD